MTFSSGERLDAADLNDLQIDSLVVDTDVFVVDKTNNRVGIGTTSPSTKLEVADSNPATLTLKGTNSVVTAGTEVQAIDFYQSDASGGAGVSARIVGVGNNSSGAQNLTFHTGQAGAASVAERVRIDSGGNVGIGTTSPAAQLDVNGAVRSTSLAISGNIFNSGVIESDGTYTNTTGSGANMHVSSGGFFFRSTSSLKYKTDVETMEDNYADAILELRPVWYRSLSEHDPDLWGYWGFIAEEVAEIDSRLVSFGVPNDYKWQHDDNDKKIKPDASDLTEPESVQYDRFVPHLVNLAKRQRDQIAELEQRVATLEA